MKGRTDAYERMGTNEYEKKEGYVRKEGYERRMVVKGRLWNEERKEGRKTGRAVMTERTDE